MLKPHHRMYLVAFLLDCALMTGFTPAPFYIFNHLEGGAGMSGVISALQFGLYAAACLVASRFVGRTKKGLRWALVGIVLYGTLFPLSITVRHPVFFAAMTIVGFASMSLVWPATQSWIGAEQNPKRRNRRISLYNISWTSGLALGTLISGRLYDVDYRLPFLTVFGLVAIAFCLVATLPNETPVARPKREESTEESDASDPDRPYLYVAWLANLIGCALVGASRAVFSKRVEDLVQLGELRVFSGDASLESTAADLAGRVFHALGSSFDVANLQDSAATQFSWLAFALCIARAITFLFMGKSSRWHRTIWLIATFQVFTAGAFWILGTTQSLTVMALCFIVAGVNGGVAYYASMHHSLTNAVKKHGRASIHEAMVGLGNFSGCLLFGLLAKQLGTTWPFLFTPAFIALAIGAEILLLRVALRTNGPERV